MNRLQENNISFSSTSTDDSKMATLSSSSSTDLSEVFEELDLKDTCYYSNVRILQYAKDVVDFSSQYGGDYSISYTALNITGRPSKYPDYGDFPETFAMRTYGKWWDIAPSKLPPIKPQTALEIPAHDFIVVRFEHYVIPEKITIFETYNPGAIIRIWAFTLTEKWVCLWEDRPQKYLPNRGRMFSPTLKKIFLPTFIIRLEFNHSHLNYFTEIDGILLEGRKCTIGDATEVFSKYQKEKAKGPIIRTLESINFRPNAKQNQEYLHDFLSNDLEKFIQESSVIQKNEVEKNNTPLSLKDMPFEILLKIFSYLDLISLFRVGQASKLMYEVSTHPLLYSELNLQPFWYLASAELLCTLAKRSTLLRKFDLSWCGLYGTVSSILRTEFKTFIQQRGDNLTHLRLNSCTFLNSSCIDTVGIACDNLKELSLRNYADPPIVNFSCLANLKNLERLDLFRTSIETDLLITMLENNPNLKHLNLAFGSIGVNMDEIAVTISKFNKQLVSIDMWKSHSLSALGLQAFSLCSELEEVDFGWCLREEALPGESLKCLLTGCPKLKKLFLAAIRGITDRDIENIANYCVNLEQLDLMGILGISTEKCQEILLKCKKLQLLDLSFCDNIDENQIYSWRKKFQNVSIKRSYVPSDFPM